MIWIGILACLFISFLFSGIESGVLSVNRVRLRHNARRGEEAAQKLDRLLDRMERLMVTVVFVTYAANILAVTLLFAECVRWLGGWGAFVALAVALPVWVLGLEFLPKAIFRRFPYRTLVIFARILTTVNWAVAPFVNAAAWLARPIFRASQEQTSGHIVAVEDLQRALALGSEDQFTEVERQLIGSVIDFRPLRAGDLMQPLDATPSVPETTEIAALAARAAESDVFIVRDASGGVTGLVRVVDLLLDGLSTGRVKSYARRVVTVPAGETALEVLRKLRAARLPVAVVTDAAQAPVGVLFADQLVRRLLAGDK